MFHGYPAQEINLKVLVEGVSFLKALQAASQSTSNNRTSLVEIGQLRTFNQSYCIHLGLIIVNCLGIIVVLDKPKIHFLCLILGQQQYGPPMVHSKSTSLP